MSPYETTSPALDAAAWQESWDRQQEAYMPDREERIAAMLDAVDAVADARAAPARPGRRHRHDHPARARRFPRRAATLLDQDPVLLAIARRAAGTGRPSSTADLRTPGWWATLPHGRYDAVLTATALHWLRAERLTALYAEIREVLRPGGVFVNADHMPDEALPALTAAARARRPAAEARYATGAHSPGGSGGSGPPPTAPRAARRGAGADYPTGHSASGRRRRPGTSRRCALPVPRGGLIWRGGTDAAVAALR